MSKQRIRRKGADGHDLILDVDLGPSRATATGSMGASTMGDMRPVLTAGATKLKSLAVGSSWRVAHRFVITGQEQRSDLRWHEPRRDRP